MLDCNTAKEYIEMFVDDALGEDERVRLFSHVDKCADCKKTLGDALRLKQSLARMGDMEPPSGLAASAIKKAKKRKVPFYAYATAGIAAAFALFFILSSSFGGMLGTPAEEAQMERSVNESVAFEEPMAAPEAAGMEEAADEMVGFDMASEAEMEESAAEEPAEQADRDTSGMGKQMGACIFEIPPALSGEFRPKLEAFIAQYDVEAQTESISVGDVITFVLEDYAFDPFLKLIEELDIIYMGELIPGGSVHITILN